MKRLLSKTVIVAVAVVFFATWGATPASAASAGTAVLTGTVTPDPIDTAADHAQAGNPGAQFGVTVQMTGTAVGVVDGAPATCGIEYNSSGDTTVAQGTGNGSLKCSGTFVAGGAFSTTCSIPYTQVGGVVLVQNGNCIGTPAGTLNAACVIQVATNIIAAECVFAIV